MIGTTEATPAVIAPGRKLGKRAAKYDRRTVALAPYIQKRKRPKITQTHKLSRRTLAAFPDLGMMRNGGENGLGCCTIAGLAHGEQAWSVYGGKPKRPTDDEIVEAYNLINDGVDEGAAMLDALKMARKVGIGGNRIFGYVHINLLDHIQARTAHTLFGGLYVGANLPMAAQSQEIWDVGDGSEFSVGSWGGHAMYAIDYDPKGLTFVTWGKLQRATWAWVDRYCDEGWGVLEEDYVGDDNRSPQGLTLKALADDLRAL